jgi:phosphatidylglycerol---prolipoprotein diacylglyceryl transferase
VYPILIQFKFPAWIDQITWIEIVATVVVLGGIFLWRRRRPNFNLRSFGFWTAIYFAGRGLCYSAGAGYDFKLHTYGVLVALGFLAGIILAARQAKKEGINTYVVLDLAFWILIAAMIGSRVLYIIVNNGDYIKDPVLLLKIWTGGLVFQGGFIGAVFASWLYCHKHKLNFLRISDLMIPYVSIGHAIGRLGCFSAGCCHGRPTELSWFGAVYSESGTVVSQNHLLHVPLHPTQLYEALGETCVFITLLMLRKRKRFNGSLLVSYLLLYPLVRFTVELFRGDPERGLLFRLDLFGDQNPEMLSNGQFVSVLMAVAGIALYFYLKKSSKSVALESPPTASSTNPLAQPTPDVSVPPPTAQK